MFVKEVSYVKYYQAIITDANFVWLIFQLSNEPVNVFMSVEVSVEMLTLGHHCMVLDHCSCYK